MPASAIGQARGTGSAGSSPRWSGTQGKLVPRAGFIVTNLARPAERVVAFYNQRGTAEQYIKEGKNAIRWTRLSCRKLRNNTVRLQLHALAYNLGNFMRTLALPKAVEHWSLTTLREKLIKIGAKVVSHGRYVTFQLAAVAVPRELFRQILPPHRWAAAGPFAAMDSIPYPSIQVARQDRCVLRSSTCALTVRNVHGAGFLIAKSARSRADHRLS